MTSPLAGRVLSFSTIGILSVTQELAGAILEDVAGAEPDVVAEETLCLVSTATARAAEVGLRDDLQTAALVSPILIDIPFLYRDYLLGSAMIVQQDSRLADAGDEVYERLRRKREFYTLHLPQNLFPGERTLTDKMGLWMGRVSPPGLPEMPTDRLARLQLVEPLLTHVKLVLAYGRKGE